MQSPQKRTVAHLFSVMTGWRSIVVAGHVTRIHANDWRERREGALFLTPVGLRAVILYFFIGELLVWVGKRTVNGSEHSLSRPGRVYGFSSTSPPGYYL